MREIQIDLELHKLIEANRVLFDEKPNDILRRILKLAEPSDLKLSISDTFVAGQTIPKAKMASWVNRGP